MRFRNMLFPFAIMFLIYPNHAAAQQNKQEHSAAIENLTKTAEQGDAKSQCELAKAYLEGRDAEAVKWFRKAADQGFAEAQGWVGALYDAGLGVMLNHFEAAKWYRKAAEQGDVWAQLNLGWMYDQGRNVKKPLPASIGGFQIFSLVDDGGGVIKQDYAEAVKWYRKAAEQGSDSAQSHLGWMYLEGRGVNKSSVEAERWLRMAAEQGDALSQCTLVAIYAADITVSQDYVQSHMWLNLCTRGIQGKKREMAIKLQEEIAKRMTPQQMVEAKQLADEFNARNVKILEKGMGATSPVALVSPNPPYTAEARQARVMGTVLVQFSVRKDGTTGSFKIVKGLGYGLDESAISTIATRWRFKPGALKGEPVDKIIFAETTFKLY